MFGTYNLINVIVIINVLIAMMNNSYQGLGYDIYLYAVSLVLVDGTTLLRVKFK